MIKAGYLALLCLLVCGVFAAQTVSIGQTSPDNSSAQQPSLPVIDSAACPFEGCKFGKWIVTHSSPIFSSWKNDEKPVATLKKGAIVTALTGIHITHEPDRILIVKPIPALGLQPGDVILRYMYRGEGFADIWVKGAWKKEYDCSFITEKDGSGCSRDCSAKVISDGRKDWWVRVKTAHGSIGWAKVKDQFDCMDALGGDPKCDNL